MRKYHLFLILSLFFTTCLIIKASQNEMNGREIIKQGIQLHDKGKYREAIKKYREVDNNDSAYVNMLSEMALSYLKLESYDTVKMLCQKALQSPTEREAHLLQILGTAYDESDSVDMAIEIYKKAIEKFPYNYLLHYNLGVSLYRTKKYSEAVKSFQEALKNNPFHASSHLNLGKITALQQQFCHAFLSFETFLLIEPNSARSNDILIFLEKLSNNYIDTAYGELITPFVPNDIFNEPDHMISSKVVLSSKAPDVVKFSATFIKQTQLMLELFPEQENSGDFWLDFYGPFFRNIKKENHLEPFFYVILTSTGKKEIVKWSKKNKNKLNEFYNSGIFLSNNRLYKDIEIEGKQVKVTCEYFESGNLYSLGNYDDNEKQHGQWKYYYGNGQLNVVGNFIHGNKNGKWIYYSSNGLLETIAEYKEGKLHGSYTEYHQNGNPRLTINYSEDTITGSMNFFYKCGELDEFNPYVNGQRNGVGISYFSNGMVETEFNYKDNELNGDYVDYFENGKVYYKEEFKNDKPHGIYEEYFPDGTLAAKGYYKEGENDSLWISYYMNGNVYIKGNYSKGKPVGEHREYWKTGNIMTIYHYNDSGKLVDNTDYYDLKGRLTNRDYYENGIIQKTVSYDTLGGIIKEYASNDGTFDFISYWSDGSKKLEGSFIKGEKNGIWKTYFRNGNIKSEYNYKNDEIHGKYITYYKNGMKEEEKNFENGKRYGSYITFYINGNIKSNGQYKDDFIDGYWYNYYPDGTLQDKLYNVNGKLHGHNYSYTVSGNLVRYDIMELGELIKRTYYDSTGKVLLEQDYTIDTIFNYVDGDGNITAKGSFRCFNFEGLYEWYYPGGNLFSSLYNFNSRDFGEYKGYYNDGVLKVEGNLLRDNRHGCWKYFHENGTLSKVSWFYNDLDDSIWYEYHENGNLKRISEYYLDEKNGIVKYFDYFGETMIYKYFQNDEIIGYRFINPDGKMCEMIKLENGNGKIIACFQNGKKSVEMEYQNGLLTGEAIYYYSNGNLYFTAMYVNGELQGEAVTYFPDGKIKEKENYFYGTLNGPYIKYNEDGSINKSGHYKLDAEHGIFTFYKNGEIDRIEKYFDGIYYTIKEKDK